MFHRGPNRKETKYKKKEKYIVNFLFSYFLKHWLLRARVFVPNDQRSSNGLYWLRTTSSQSVLYPPRKTPEVVRRLKLKIIRQLRSIFFFFSNKCPCAWKFEPRFLPLFPRLTRNFYIPALGAFDCLSKTKQNKKSVRIVLCRKAFLNSLKG